MNDPNKNPFGSLSTGTPANTGASLFGSSSTSTFGQVCVVVFCPLHFRPPSRKHALFSVLFPVISLKMKLSLSCESNISLYWLKGFLLCPYQFIPREESCYYKLINYFSHQHLQLAQAHFPKVISIILNASYNSFFGTGII